MSFAQWGGWGGGGGGKSINDYKKVSVSGRDVYVYAPSGIAEAPEGWAKWVIPAAEYLVVDCTPQTYGAVFQQTLLHVLPDNGCELAGAVHEYYDPQDEGGGMRLYFPVRR